jgi:hypothetical protein
MENRNCGTGAAEQTSTLQHYLNLLAARRDSMTALIDLLPANPVIVETGCVRQEDNWEGDGCSTLIWNALVAERGGRAYSVDTDPTAVALAQRLAPRVEVTCGDSIAFLAQLKIDSIDLLYLDGKDFSVGFDDQLSSSLHAMHELCAAAHCKPKIVAIDDTCPDRRALLRLGNDHRRLHEKIGAERWGRCCAFPPAPTRPHGCRCTGHGAFYPASKPVKYTQVRSIYSSRRNRRRNRRRSPRSLWRSLDTPCAQRSRRSRRRLYALHSLRAHSRGQHSHVRSHVHSHGPQAVGRDDARFPYRRHRKSPG